MEWNKNIRKILFYKHMNKSHFFHFGSADAYCIKSTLFAWHSPWLERGKKI